MRRVLVPLAVAGLVVSAGCAGREGGTDAADANGGAAAVDAGQPGAEKPDAKRQEVENLIADCMKKQGFRYEPHVSPEGEPKGAGLTNREAILAPTDQVRKFREKYGFGVMSKVVYPNDPVVTVPTVDPAKNPNNAIRDGLDAGRQKAYDLALEGVVEKGESSKHKGDTIKPGCADQAYTTVFGDTEPDEPDLRARKQAWAAFQTDPQAVAGAQKWADCLRGQGFKVDSARPGDIETAISEMAVDGRLQADSGLGPDVIPTEAATAAVGGSAPLSAQAGKQALQREIKAALADLDCRPDDYAALVRGKYAKVLENGDGQG